MRKRFIADIINRILSPFGAVIVPKWEIRKEVSNPYNPGALRLRLFKQFARKGFNPTFHIITEFMRDYGYEPYDITDLNRRPSDGALALIEVAFAKKPGLLRDHHGW